MLRHGCLRRMLAAKSRLIKRKCFLVVHGLEHQSFCFWSMSKTLCYVAQPAISQTLREEPVIISALGRRNTNKKTLTSSTKLSYQKQHKRAARLRLGVMLSQSLIKPQFVQWARIVLADAQINYSLFQLMFPSPQMPSCYINALCHWFTSAETRWKTQVCCCSGHNSEQKALFPQFWVLFMKAHNTHKIFMNKSDWAGPLTWQIWRENNLICQPTKFLDPWCAVFKEVLPFVFHPIACSSRLFLLFLFSFM